MFRQETIQPRIKIETTIGELEATTAAAGEAACGVIQQDETNYFHLARGF
jgi:hypothetical protein